MPLRPLENVQKVLISTTSRLVGEFEQDGILFAHAWPDFYDQSATSRWQEGPMSRSAFVFAFETEPVNPEEAGIQEFSPMGDLICGYLSVLFGKRFDNHGMLEGTGLFRVPNLTQFSQSSNHTLPQNSHSPRKDFAVPLNLGEISRISPLLKRDVDLRWARAFKSATKFYLQALQTVERDPEVAYLHLITTGEILSNFHEYDKDQLLDDQCKEALAKIIEGLPGGQKIANLFSTRLLQIKRRFTRTIVDLVGTKFFERSEASQPYAGFKIQGFRDAIAAAYDLRSRYVHTGVPFGSWVSRQLPSINNEIQVGIPVLDDKQLSKIIATAPTYLGLERVIRYCLLEFAQLNGAYIEPASV